MKFKVFAIFLGLVSCFELQGEVAQETNVEIQRSKRPNGYYYSFGLTAGMNFSDSSEVIGEKDGLTSTYNLKLKYSSVLIQDNVEWENMISASETFTQTPAIEDRLIKSGDQFNYLSFYKRFSKTATWLGLFGKFAVSTSLFEGFDERGQEVNYLVSKSDGTTESIRDDRLKLTDSLRPATFKESLGAIARLHETRGFTLEVRTGPASKQILNGGQFSVKDDEETENTVEVVELGFVRTTGVEFGAEASGFLADGDFEYRVFAEALYPFEYSPKSDNAPEESKLVSTEAGIEAQYNATQWLALNYSLSVKREPLVKPESQVNQAFMATATYKIAASE